MTTTKPELPQALHTALLACQVAQDARSRAHTAWLDAEIQHRPKATISRLHQAHVQAVQQADAAFRDLGRALDAEGGHDLWRIVYLKGGRTRSRIQVRPTRDSHRRREAQARLDLRRELAAQGAQVQYLVSLPVALIPDADGWDRTRGMVRLGYRRFQARASLGDWCVVAYGQAPEPTPDPDTCGATHLDQSGVDAVTYEPVDSTWTCTLAKGHDGWHQDDTDPEGGLVRWADPCLAKYADGWDFACTLPQGHDGQHQDQVTDAPAIVAWYATQAAWNVARHIARPELDEAIYARTIAYLGRCPACQAQVGNHHADTCGREGIVGALDLDAAPRQDRPRASRTAQDGRNAPDLTGWAPGEIQEAYGR